MILPTITIKPHLVIRTLNAGSIVEETAGRRKYVLKRASEFCDHTVACFLHQVFHPGLPKCLGEMTGSDDLRYYVFEYQAGQTLDQWKKKTEDCEQTNHRLLALMIEWGQILSFLHQNGDKPVIHCDIKPGNLIVTDDDHAFLIDFGSARRINQPADQIDSPVRQAATPSYAAPELLRGEPQPESDLYALGLTFLVLITAQSPENVRSIPLKEQLPSACPEWLRVFGICLHSDPVQRYSSVDLLVQDLISIDQNPACRWPVIRSRQGDLPAKQIVTSKTQTQTVSRSSEQSVRAPFLCVWGNSACGCELACALADQYSVLVFDADLLNLRADLLLGKPRHEKSSSGSHRDQGIDLTVTAVETITPQAIQYYSQKTARSNVHLLKCINQIEDYAFCKVETMSRVIQSACLTTELLIVLCSSSVFDAYTCYCLLTADQIIAPVRGDLASFRMINQAVEFLVKQYQFQSDRLDYIAFNYLDTADLSVGTMSELCQGHLTACISETSARRSHQYSRIPYAARMSPKTEREYIRLTRRFSPGFQLRKEHTDASRAIPSVDDHPNQSA